MISVIIPMYNSSNTIIKAIEGVINQTQYDKIDEIIVVNDGSTDNSLEVVENFNKNFENSKIKIINQENKGVSSARNSGIKEAKGEWIALLDSDDEWLPEKIEKQLEMIEKYPDIKFIGTGRNKENLKLGKKVCEGLYKLKIINLLFKYWPHTSTVLIKKDIIIENGLFDENRHYAEDGQLWLKIARDNYIYYLSESLEIAGDNKRTFGKSGLSGNIKMMYKGCKNNIEEAYLRGDINKVQKIFFNYYENIKYLKRIIITRVL